MHAAIKIASPQINFGHCVLRVKVMDITNVKPITLVRGI